MNEELKINPIKVLSKRKKTLSLALNILTWVIFGIIAIAVFSVLIQRITGQTPNLFGYRYYYVLTSSMSPELEPGEVILSRVYNEKKDKPEISIGDNVTFVIPDGSRAGSLNTHKVVTAPYYDESKGSYYIITKGVNNVIADAPTPVLNIQSVMIRKSPMMTQIYGMFLKSNIVLIILFLVPFITIIGSLLFKLFVTLKQKTGANSTIEVTDEEFKKKVIAEYLEKQNKKVLPESESEKTSNVTKEKPKK